MVGPIKQFKYVMPSQNSAWDKMKANREKLGAALSSTQSVLAAVTSSLAQAHTDKISGMANLAAQAGLDRINAARKAMSQQTLKQIDDVQAQVDQAKIAAELKKRYYVYTLPPVVLVDTSSTDGGGTDTTA